MYEIKTTAQYRTDFNKLSSNDKKLVLSVVQVLANGDKLGNKFNDHPLHGDKEGIRDCHIRPNLVLLYKIDKASNILFLIRIGNHSNTRIMKMSIGGLKESVEEETKALRKAYDKLSKDSKAYACIYGYIKAGKINYFDKPLLKNNAKEVENFVYAFSRGKEGMKINAKVLYRDQLNKARRSLGLDKKENA